MKLVIFCGVVSAMMLSSVSGKSLGDTTLFRSDVGFYEKNSESPSYVGIKSRKKRSLTAFLAAEVLILERILAAQQNARKPRKIAAARPSAIHNNNIDFRSKTKSVRSDDQ